MSSTAPERPIHIPAWKRIGLRLKLQPARTALVDTESANNQNLKRKSPALNCDGSVSKLLKNSETNLVSSESLILPTPSPPRKKLVSFTSETKAEDGDSSKKLFNNYTADQGLLDSTQALKVENIPDAGANAATHSVGNGKNSKKIKRSKSNVAKPSKELKHKAAISTLINTPPFLKYLGEYSESKQSWKFNKNHQTHLLKHIFDVKSVPPEYDHLIYVYIRGLKGQVRTRLRDEALAIKVNDQEDGAAGFPSTMLDIDQRQKEYESALSEYIAVNLSSHVPKKGLEKFVFGIRDEFMKSRIVRRIRAEMILNELAFSSHEDSTSHQDTRPKEDLGKARLEIKSSSRISRKRKQRTVNLSSSSSDVSDKSESEMIDSTDNEEISSGSVSSASLSSSGSESDGE